MKATAAPDIEQRPVPGASEKREASPAAQRALAEAEARRKAGSLSAEVEIGGRGGLDPVRFGDWEVRGLASDF